MDIIEAIKTRKSIRGFKKDPVPREIIEKILEAAVRTPSGMNTQPWEFIVATGEVLDKIRNDIGELFDAGVPITSDMYRKPFEGIYRQRQIALAVELFRLMGIAREDKQARHNWMRHGFRFFEAPCEIAVCGDKSMGEHLDILGVGALTQTICLAAMGYGLGTCIADQGILYDQSWRKYGGVPDSKRIVAGITIGYPEPGFPANKIVSSRVPASEITTWLGW